MHALNFDEGPLRRRKSRAGGLLFIPIADAISVHCTDGGGHCNFGQPLPPAAALRWALGAGRRFARHMLITFG